MTVRPIAALLLAAAAALPLAACSSTSASDERAAAGGLVETTPSKDYPLDTCVVTGAPLPKEPFAYLHNGREVQFCCPACSGQFVKDPQKYLQKLDAASGTSMRSAK